MTIIDNPDLLKWKKLWGCKLNSTTATPTTLICPVLHFLASNNYPVMVSVSFSKQFSYIVKCVWIGSFNFFTLKRDEVDDSNDEKKTQTGKKRKKSVRERPASPNVMKRRRLAANARERRRMNG